MAETTFLHEHDGGADGENQVSFVMDLFHHQSNSPSLLPLVDSNLTLDLELGLGFCFENDDLDNNDDDMDNYGCGFMSTDCKDEFFVTESSIPADGMRESVFSCGFESDSDEEIDLNQGFQDENGSDQIFGDLFELEDQREDFEWEEVDGRVDEREMMSVFFDADVDDDVGEREFMNMFFDADMDDDMDVSIAMEEDLGTEQVSNLDWEMLLNIHNLDPNVDDEYELLAAQLAWNGSQNPPASRSAVKDLKVVIVTKEEVDGEDASCAICKEDMVVGEKVKLLPCSHFYHEYCIDPWLGMKNTCPVCRYELQTDDAEYERRKREREVH